jgi:hypothetical protein
MNLKSEITLKLAEILEYEIDEKSLKKYQKTWWVNSRNKTVGGLQLSSLGFQEMKNAQIKYHKLKIEEKLEYTNQTLIRLDQYIDCPWHIIKNDMYVFSDKMAVQLVLFSGNLKRFIEAKAKSKTNNY